MNIFSVDDSTPTEIEQKGFTRVEESFPIYQDQNGNHSCVTFEPEQIYCQNGNKECNSVDYNMFIDDERFPPSGGRKWYIARNKEHVLYLIHNMGFPGHISFDHDLGINNSVLEPTGYDIAKILVDIDIHATETGNSNLGFGKNFSFYVHSQNPVGKRNIASYLNNYFEFKNA